MRYLPFWQPQYDATLTTLRSWIQWNWTWDNLFARLEKKKQTNMDVCKYRKRKFGKKALLFSRYQYQTKRNEPIIFPFVQSQQKTSLKFCLSFWAVSFLRVRHQTLALHYINVNCLDWNACMCPCWIHMQISSVHPNRSKKPIRWLKIESWLYLAFRCLILLISSHQKSSNSNHAAAWQFIILTKNTENHWHFCAECFVFCRIF